MAGIQTQKYLYTGRIDRAYDSHVHWRMTGARARRLNLKNINTTKDVYDLSPTEENKIGDWLVGFGWDQHQFTDLELSENFPTRKILDERFGNTPVFFERIDGHAAWVNTAALELAQIFTKNITSSLGGKICLDQGGLPTGVLIDKAMSHIYNLLPHDSIETIRHDLLSAQKVFHRAGFTHIRDLTCDLAQWQVAHELAQKNELQLAVEAYFHAMDVTEFQKSLENCIELKKQNLPNLKSKGVKIFFDGALGSEGAWISQNYLSGSGQGLRLFSDEELTFMLTRASERNITLAVHVIGDEAAHRFIQVASQLRHQSNIKNICNIELEHVELLRPETTQLIKNLPVTCFMQPCHWLSDKKWLKNKIGALTQYAFQWAALEQNEIPFYFGSDCPIEESSIQNNYYAVRDAEQNGIPLFRSGFSQHHSHPDANFGPQSFTQISEGRVAQVVFEDQDVFKG